MRLRAQPLELRAAVDEHVVRVEAGEARTRREPDKRRLPEYAHARQLQVQRAPVGGRKVAGTVDVDVVDAVGAEVREIVADRGDGATGIRLELRRDPDPVP